ncbi:hypothetical protein YC2023_024642 [Brassica napus]
MGKPISTKMEVGWSSGSHKVCSDSQDSVIDGGRSGILASGSSKGSSEDYDGYVYHKDDWNRVSSMALDGGTVETLGLKLFACNGDSFSHHRGPNINLLLNPSDGVMGFDKEFCKVISFASFKLNSDMTISFVII